MASSLDEIGANGADTQPDRRRAEKTGVPARPIDPSSRGKNTMLGAKLGITDYLTRVCQEIQNLDPAQIETVSELVEAAYDDGRFVFIIGNGGSGANASHLCEDLAKCTLRDFESQKRLKVLSLTDNTAGIMAWANDEGYDRIFLEQLKTLASPGDLLLAISGSGNSPNILKAVDWANEHGLTTVGITGFSGGKLKNLAHHNLHAAIDDMGIVESLHQVVFHWIIDDLYRRFSAKELVHAGAGAT
jgi:D-sedoheptulose 7-phosphate isomerase